MSEPTASFTRTSRRSQNSSSEEAYAGLDLSVLTPPLSPAEAAEKRVKREKGLSDVGQKFSSNIPLVIEDHICAGPLYIPAPRAYRTIPLEIASVWEEQHMNDSVLKILKEHNLEWDSIDVLQFASTDQVADFILIRTINNAVDERWIKVAEAIISLCRNCGLQTINVEIADRRGLIPTISWAIAAEEPLVQDWHNVEPIILQLLRPNMTWLSIDVLVRGKRFSTFNETKVVSTPTIVIRIERDSQETWTEQRDRIDLFLQSNERYKSFAVEILRSSCDYLGGLDFSFLQEHHRKKLWERKGYMGASIGPVKSDFPAGSGTCGCFLQMRSGDTIRHLALTCFHVVLPTDPMEPEKDQPAHAVRWIRRGFALGDEGSHDLPIRMPSGNDYEQWLRDCESEIEKIETSKIGQWTFKELREMESQGDALEDRMPKIHLRDFNAKKGFLEFTQSSIDKARCANGESGENSLFGWVCGGSGLRRNRDMLMDWAVIDMLPGREPEKNELPPISPDMDPKRFPRWMVDSSSPTIGEKVYKVGRTSGLTGGTISAIRRTQHLKGWQVEENGELEYKTGYVWTIASGTEGKPFGEPGDSGSAIYNQSCQFKGLLLGGSELNELGGTAYFISADDCFRDIKEIMGADDVTLLGSDE